MEVSDVTPQKKRGRYNLFVDGEFWFGVSERSIAKGNLYKGKTISEDELEGVFLSELQYRVYDRCIRKLANRPNSHAEMERYIRSVLWKKRQEWFGKTRFESNFKQYERMISEHVLGLLETNGLISDESFAKWWVEQRTRNGQKGWILIQSELQQKGVSREIIESVRITDEEKQKLIRRSYDAICKKRNLSRERCIQRLLSRGFSWDEIREVLPDDNRK